MSWPMAASTTVTTILWVAASIIAIAGAVAALVKGAQWIRRPVVENRKHIAELSRQEKMDLQKIWVEIDLHTERLEQAFTIISEDQAALHTVLQGQKVIFKALWGVLEHSINPNASATDLTKIQTELMSHIIDT